MSTLVVFDMDGVLVDTRPVVEESYRDVGVEMPDHAWGRPWREWLVDLVGNEDKAQSLHSAKGLAYRRRLRRNGVAELPAATVARELKEDALVVTSSARSTAGLILDIIGVGHHAIGGAYLTLAHRARVVGYWATLRPKVVYVDDLVDNAKFITMATNVESHVITPEVTTEVVRSWTQ